jgi:hypothetical protein
MFKLIPVALAALMLTSCAPLYARSVSVEFDDRPRRTVVVKKRQPRVVVVEQRPAVVVIQQQRPVVYKVKTAPPGHSKKQQRSRGRR